jgi:predicted nucleic acid-binding protein
VVSFLEKGDTRARDYVPHLEGKSLVLSFMTFAELKRWALARNWGEDRRRRLEQWIQKDFAIHSDMTSDLCRTWAEVSDQRSRKGREIRCADAWIAATALVLDIPLVTNNVKDFEEIDGLVLLSATS